MENEIKYDDTRERDWIVPREDVFVLDSSNSSSTTQEIKKPDTALYPNAIESFLCFKRIAPYY